MKFKINIIVISFSLLTMLFSQSSNEQSTSLVSEYRYIIEGSQNIEDARESCISKAVQEIPNTQPMLPPGSLAIDCIMENKESLNILEELSTENYIYIKLEVVIPTELLFSSCVSFNNGTID